MMRTIDKIILHCTATRKGQDFSVSDIREWHTSPPRNWSDIGYHFIIRNDENGTIERGRPIERVGAHVKGQNATSIGVAYVGGVDNDLKSEDTMTTCQEESFLKLVEALRMVYGDELLVYGHNDFTNKKQCPSFKVKEKFPRLVV